jgi:hydrogenase nickel incorporation protein HypA/HybF
MHELSIASAVVDTAVAHARGRRVAVVSVRAGALRQVVPASLHFYFGIVSRDTVAEGARLDVEEVAARLACRDCQTAWTVESPAFRCPGCGGGDVEVRAGDELEVESIEVEEEDAACIA